MMATLNNSKIHTVTAWSNDWTVSTQHELIIFEALQNDLLDAGIKASTVFNEDGDAYVIKVESEEGDFEIGPGTLTFINGQEVLTSRVSGLNVYREDGSTVEFNESTDFEAFILTIIEACRH